MAREGGHRMPGGIELLRQGLADETGGAGKSNLHGIKKRGLSFA